MMIRILIAVLIVEIALGIPYAMTLSRILSGGLGLVIDFASS